MDLHILLLLLVAPLLLEARLRATSSRHTETTTEYYFVGSHLYNDTGVLTSPNFPDRYPGGYRRYSYIIENTAGGNIKLIFDDFLLSDKDNCKICRDGPNCTTGLYMYYYGTTSNRPSAVISMGSMLYIEFTVVSHADEGFAVGFKASYQFVRSSYWENKPQVLGIFHDEASQQLFYSSRDWFDDVDVVWTIKAPSTDHHIWLRFNVSLSYEPSTPAITIIDGVTSEGLILGQISGGLHGSGEYSAFSISDGMYIRLKTTMNGDTYNNYDYVWGLYVEYIGADIVSYDCPHDYFLCTTTHICISKSLTCDGITQCGDWSDETTHTCQDVCSECLHGNCECYGGDSCECLCDEGYYGDNCQHKDVCLYCYNSGYCDTVSHECVCPEDYYGSQCEYYYSDNSYYMILYVCGGLIGLVLTCLCSLALSRRRYSSRHRPCTVSAMAGFTETDYANSFHQLNSDTERLTDPNLFYNMEAPPEYSLCVDGNAFDVQQRGQSDSTQSDQMNAGLDNNGIPDEPPPSYDDCTLGQQPTLENDACGVDSGSEQRHGNLDEPKEESEINPNESTA